MPQAHHRSRPSCCSWEPGSSFLGASGACVGWWTGAGTGSMANSHSPDKAHSPGRTAGGESEGAHGPRRRCMPRSCPRPTRAPACAAPPQDHLHLHPHWKHFCQSLFCLSQQEGDSKQRSSRGSARQDFKQSLSPESAEPTETGRCPRRSEREVPPCLTGHSCRGPGLSPSARCPPTKGVSTLTGKGFGPLPLPRPRSPDLGAT